MTTPGTQASPGCRRDDAIGGLALTASLLTSVALALTAEDGFLLAFATAETLVIAAAGALLGAYAFALQRVDFTR